MDTDNLNIETRLPDLIALWLESRRTDMEWPASTALPLTANAWSDDLATPGVTINVIGYNTTRLIGQMELEVVINFRNTTNTNGISFALENRHVSRLRREIARGQADTLGFIGWLRLQTTAYKKYMTVEHFRHGTGGAIQINEEDHTRTRQTRVSVCVLADEITEP